MLQFKQVFIIQVLCLPLGHFVMLCLLRKSRIEKLYIVMHFILKKLIFFSLLTAYFYM